MRGKWAIPAIAVLILGTLGFSQEVEAITITISDETSCLEIPGAAFSDPNCFFFSDFTVGSGDILIIENTIQVLLLSVFTNFGTVELNGGDADNLGSMIASQFGGIINECGGVINTNGGAGVTSGVLAANDPSSFITNKGTINLFGGTGPLSGVLGIVNFAIGNNHDQAPNHNEIQN